MNNPLLIGHSVPLYETHEDLYHDCPYTYIDNSNIRDFVFINMDTIVSLDVIGGLDSSLNLFNLETYSKNTRVINKQIFNHPMRSYIVKPMEKKKYFKIKLSGDNSTLIDIITPYEERKESVALSKLSEFHRKLAYNLLRF